MRLGRIGVGIFAVLAMTFGMAGNANAQSVQYEKPYISDFDINYHLGRDDERRSTLAVTERITVEYPEYTNKGIVREIPRVYDGHSVSLKLDSVTRNGQAEPIYSQYTQGNFEVVETGTDDYINGTQVFEFTYTLRDVTKFFANTNADEFYWDTNGTGWRSYISQLSVSLTIDESLRGQLNGNIKCYQGGYGESGTCELQSTDNGFALQATNLAPGENATIAVGFESGTFAAYEMSLVEKIVAVWGIVVVVTGVIGSVIIIWLTTRAHKQRYRTRELGTIAPEYLPPQNASVAASAAVSPGYSAQLAAQLTDLAVRHYIQIIETSPKKGWTPAEYAIKIIRDTSDLRVEEQEIIGDVLGYKPYVGAEKPLNELKHSDTAYLRFRDNDKKLQKLMREQYGFEQIDADRRRWFGKTAKILLLFAVITLSPVLLIASIVAFVTSKTLWVLTDKGLGLRRYLKGLEMYIKVAETERLKMLQSPEGAAKVAVDTNDAAQIVKLYERVLPYAVLFRQEKEWAKRIGDLYDKTEAQPDWINSQTAFNAAMFGSMMSNFSSSASATSASSSSSGGSGGGGFSGGGGGGGGGGFR